MPGDIYRRIEAYCEENGLFNQGDGVVVGLSGGADSVFLLYALARLKKRWSLELRAVHINHGIRGDEALRDEAYAVSFAGGLGIPCSVYRADIPSLSGEWHMTEEEAGRAYRYQCFAQCRKEHSFQKIAVAHHQDDQAETVLFQLIRGSSLRGLGGMRPKRGEIVRPLLGISRAEIEKALQQEGIAFCEDTTNTQSLYARNCLRNQVIPLLQREIQPAAIFHIAKTGERLREAIDYLDRQRDEAYQRLVRREEGKRSVPYEAYAALAPVLQKEIVLKMMEELAGRRKDISSSHIEIACDIFAGNAGRRAMLPYGIEAQKSYGVAILCRRQEGAGKQEGTPSFLNAEIVFRHEYQLPLLQGETMRVVFEKAYGGNFMGSNLKKHCTKSFDYDKMDIMPRFRYPEEGDYLWLDHTGKRKKLSRLFIDRKVEKNQRDNILVLADGHHILWVPALGRCSARYYISENTKTVIYAHCMAGGEI